MIELRLAWEPETLSESSLVSRQVLKYMDNAATFAQFKNGTCLMLKPVEKLQEVIQGVMREARTMPDFRVYNMEEGDYLVFFASPLLVYVGKDEFAARKVEIETRLSELFFPSETVKPLTESGGDTIMVGLYARGKLQRDAWGQDSHMIVRPV
jgi:hypothetical protein